MFPLDPKTLLAQTLKPFATGGRAGVPGYFERYLLEPTDNDTTAISTRLADVKAIWDKSLEHSRYGDLAKKLAAEHEDAELLLLDPSERAQLASEAQRAADVAAAKAKTVLAEWRELLAEHAGDDGLTPAARSMLERMAAREGIDPALAQTELEAAPVAAPPPVMPPEIRAQVSKALQDLARADGEERLALSLYHALGLEGPTSDLALVQRRFDELEARMRKQAHGQKATAYKTVLAHVKLHLLERDPRAYVEGLIEDIGTAMEFEFARLAGDRLIDPVESESLLESAMRRGLTPDLARRLISELARDAGAVVQTGEHVDYVACPACNTPHARPSAPRHCKRCGTSLFLDCPADGCGTRNDATALRCSNCQIDLHRYAEASRRVKALPDAVDAGRILWAAAEIEEIARVLGASAIPDDLRSRVDRLNRDAEATWKSVESAIGGRRLYGARAALRGLARTAGDVLGPNGVTPDAAGRRWIGGSARSTPLWHGHGRQAVKRARRR